MSEIGNPVPIEVLQLLSSYLDHPNQFGALAKVCRSWNQEFSRPGRVRAAYEHLERAWVHQMLAVVWHDGTVENIHHPSPQLYGQMEDKPDAYSSLDANANESFEFGRATLKLKPPTWSWRTFRKMFREEFSNAHHWNRRGGFVHRVRIRYRQNHAKLRNIVVGIGAIAVFANLYCLNNLIKTALAKSTAISGNWLTKPEVNRLILSFGALRIVFPLCSLALQHHKSTATVSLYQQDVKWRLTRLGALATIPKLIGFLVWHRAIANIPDIGQLKFAGLMLLSATMFGMGEAIWHVGSRRTIPGAPKWNSFSPRAESDTETVCLDFDAKRLLDKRLLWMQSFAQKMSWDGDPATRQIFDRFYFRAMSHSWDIYDAVGDPNRKVGNQPSDHVDWLRKQPPIDLLYRSMAQQRLLEKKSL